MEGKSVQKFNFNLDWKFTKEGTEIWNHVVLPHDAMIHEERSKDNPGGSAIGYFPGGVYIYEKKFIAPKEWKHKTVSFEFEGVYQNSIVYINEKKAGGRPYGYIPFVVCADDLLNYGEENTIRVVVDNSKQPNSRWYTGSGIYRPVNMILGNKTHIEWQGVKISTLAYSPAKIQIETLANGGEVQVEIIKDDKILAKGTGASITLNIPDANLWSDENPNLYQCHVTLMENGKVLDEVTDNFGIRKVEWSSKGLFINGQETLLRGGCVHHDNGILGACTYGKSEERRVRILKQLGYNAIRSSHNPACKELLDACDKYGMYVIDETWDMWYNHKNEFDYASDFKKWYKKDIEAVVEHDFNHPSVIMYSIGNEISEPVEEKGITLTKEMVEYIHELDGNRAVTCGVNLMIIKMASKGKGIYREDGKTDEANQKKRKKAVGSTLFNMITSIVGTGMNKKANSGYTDRITSPCLDALDIAGYNYASGRYKMEGKKHPNRVVVGSETFPQEICKNWKMVKEYPYLIGDFMWTSWDYLGEAGIGAWTYEKDGTSFEKPYPWLISEAGAIDILGNIGAEAKYASIVWGIDENPYIGVCPVNHPGVRVSKAVWRGTNARNSWSWKNCDGNKAEIEIYADAASVKLIINNKVIGKKKIKDCKAKFKTKYQTGTIEAISYDAMDKEIGRSELKSATGVTKLEVTPEENTIKEGEIVYINIAIVGQNGVIESNDDRKISINLENGELLGFGSANPRTEERFDDNKYTTYYGRAQAVVRGSDMGDLIVHVSGGNFETVTMKINVEQF